MVWKSKGEWMAGECCENEIAEVLIDFLDEHATRSEIRVGSS